MKHTPFILIGIAIISTAVILTVNGLTVTQPNSTSKNSTSPSVLSSTPAVAQQASSVTDKEITNIHVPILMYHYIRTVTDPRDGLGARLSVTPEMFEQQMKILKDEGFSTITLDDLASAWRLETHLPEKPIILTFDDGYEDFYTTAFPILKKYNFKATTYIVTNFIDKDRYMTKAQLVELSGSPLITIGAHTMNHIDLSQAASTKLHEEIFTPKVWLESVTGYVVHHFCYPSGKYNALALQQVEAAGYTTATTTNPGTIHDKRYPFTITRQRVSGKTSIKNFETLIHQ